MIIIKTKEGNAFVNDHEIEVLTYDRLRGVVRWKKEMPDLKCVESVTYISDAQPCEYKADSSEVDRLKEKVNRILDKLAFAREGFITAHDMARAAYLRLFPEIECIAEGEEKNFDATYLVETFKEVKEIFDKGFEKIRKEYDDRKARDEGEGGGSAAQEA